MQAKQAQDIIYAARVDGPIPVGRVQLVVLQI